MKWLRIVLAAVCIFGCSTISRMGVRGDLEAYRGEGQIELLVRPQWLGKETYGYVLTLPRFRTDANFQKVYRLTGLPPWRSRLNVELATFNPVFSQPISVANRRALSIPESHAIACELLGSDSGQRFGHFKGTIYSTGVSSSLQFRGATFMKHLFACDVNPIQLNEELELTITYDVGDSPIPGHVQIVIIMDAPANT